MIREDPGTEDLAITLPASPAPDELPRYIKNIGDAGGMLIVAAADEGTDSVVVNGQEIAVFFDALEGVWRRLPDSHVTGFTERPIVTPG